MENKYVKSFYRLYFYSKFTFIMWFKKTCNLLSRNLVCLGVWAVCTPLLRVYQQTNAIYLQIVLMTMDYDAIDACTLRLKSLELSYNFISPWYTNTTRYPSPLYHSVNVLRLFLFFIIIIIIKKKWSQQMTTGYTFNALAAWIYFCFAMIHYLFSFFDHSLSLLMNRHHLRILSCACASIHIVKQMNFIK